MKSHKKLIALGGLVALVATTASYVTFSGNPRWPLSGGFHYVVDLHPTSFPTTTNTSWMYQARKSLSDWERASIGGTTYVPGWRSAATDAGNHGNGINTWIWSNQPTQSWLGVTYVRWSGSTMTDCDIWYNSRGDYSWTDLRTNPCEASASTPYSFRGVARHEHGHALGLDHESARLNCMQPVYNNGTMLAHLDAGANTSDFSYAGMLPHADDKAGVRFLYPLSQSAYNVMATNWDSPAGSRRRLSGSFPAGSLITLPGVTLENQSNQAIAGGSTGIRVGIYLSTNSTISPADTKIGEYTFSGTWGAHATGNYTTLGGTIPTSTAPGTYWVGAIFDNTGVQAEGPRSTFETSAAYGADNAAECGQITVTAAPGTYVTYGSGCPGSGGAGRLVLPKAYASKMGSGANTFPHARANMRYQQMFLGSEFAKAQTWDGLCLRLDETNGGPAQTQSLAVYYGDTTYSLTTLTTAFDKNWRVGPVQLFDGKVNLPAWSGGGTTSSWGICIKFSRPATWGGASNVNLLLEIVNKSTSASSHYEDYCSGATDCTTTRLYATSSATATTGTLGTNQGLVMSLTSSGGASPILGNVGVPGVNKTFRVTLADARPSTAALLYLGLRTNVALPGGCSLLATPLVLLTSVATSSAGAASVTIGVPNNTALLGVKFSNQYWVLDPQGALLNILALSNGGEGTVGG